MSTACRSRMHDVCRGYTDGYETYRCGCRCHDEPVGTAVNIQPGVAT